VIRRIFAIAAAGLIELIRSRIYLNLLVAGIALVASALILDRLAGTEVGRVIVDLGLSFIALLVAVLAGTTMIIALTRELETKRIHLIVGRPIARFEIVIGRFLTIAVLVLVSNLVLGGLLAGIGVGIGLENTHRILFAAMFASFEGFIVAAIAAFFGVGSSSTMSAVFVTAIFMAGRLTSALESVIAQGKLDGPIRPVMEVVQRVLPQLPIFDVTEYARGAATLSFADAAVAAGYGVLYCAGLLLLASFRLERRDLM
jgi:ABC-type transport system involved in multi-copper enzyme maturation permease subunit